MSLYHRRGVCISMNVVLYPKYVQNAGVLIRSFIYYFIKGIPSLKGIRSIKRNTFPLRGIDSIKIY